MKGGDYMKKSDYQDVIDKQIKKLEEIQGRSLSAADACLVSETICRHLASRLEYETFKK